MRFTELDPLVSALPVRPVLGRVSKVPPALRADDATFDTRPRAIVSGAGGVREPPSGIPDGGSRVRTAPGPAGTSGGAGPVRRVTGRGASRTPVSTR
ncbi:hypothetical protein GCM10010498_20270 [Streptomyces cavourensis]|nr:hypothetical protein GCM10010498_20270 [Streptomyces cavourensis]